MRRKQLNMDHLQYYRLVSRWACKTHNLPIASLELLFYLNPIEYFTVDDFRTGELLVSWDSKRFYKLIQEDWIKKVFKNNGRKGGHNRYSVSRKGKRLLNRIGRILDGGEDLPESVARNKIMAGEKYTDKLYSAAIKKFNKTRA